MRALFRVLVLALLAAAIAPAWGQVQNPSINAVPLVGATVLVNPTLSNPTITGTVSGGASYASIGLSGTVTGTYTLGGTPTIVNGLTVGGTSSSVAVSGSSGSAANSSIYGYVNSVTGSYTGSQPNSIYQNFINSLAVDGSGGGASQRNTRVYTNLGGASHKGGFINFDTTLNLNQATGNTTNQFYQASNVSANAATNDGGVLGTPSGSLFAEGLYSVLKTGATYWTENSIMEGDLSAQTGTNVKYSYGYKLILQSDNAVAPDIEQVAFNVGGATGATPTITCVLCVGNYSSVNPLASSASLLSYSRKNGTGSYPQATIAYGIDLFYFDTTSAAWRGPNGTSLITDTGVSTFGIGDSSTNTVRITPVAAGNPATITSIGGDTNQTLRILGKGVSGVDLGSGTNGNGLRASADSSAVNYWDFHGTSGSAAYVTGTGTGSRIDLRFYGKGANSILQFGANGNSPNNGNSDFEIDGGSTSTSWLKVTGSASAAPTLGCVGTSCVVNIAAPKFTTSASLSNLVWSATAPTIASGGCTTGSAQSISANNGTAAFAITLGGATCGSTIVLTMPAAATGWVCDAHDITTPATNTVEQSAGGSTTSVTLTNYNRTTGVAANFTGADVLATKCSAY